MHTLNQLHQLPKLDVTQTTYINIFLECIEQLTLKMKDNFNHEDCSQFLRELTELRLSKPQMFKEFDDWVESFLRKQLANMVLRLQISRPQALERMEECYQEFRALDVYRAALEQICPSGSSRRAEQRSVLVAGCGRCPEARWLIDTWTDDFFHFADINGLELEKLQNSLGHVYGVSNQRCAFYESDLRDRNSLEKIRYGSFLFFHPMLLDFKLYASLLRQISIEKDSKKRRELLAAAQINTDSKTIFDNLINQLPSGGSGVVTVVDGLEAQALMSYLQSVRNLTFTVVHNPYALKKLGVYIAQGSMPRESEQRTYHYVFRIHKT